MEKFQLEEYFHYSVLVMKYVGLWPKVDYSSNKLYLAYTIILHAVFNLAMSIGFIGYLLTSSNLLEDAIHSGYITLGIMATVKAFLIFKYNKVFQLLLDKEILTIIGVDLSEQQNKILCDYVGFWRRLNINYIYLSVVLSLGFVVLPMFSKTPYSLPGNCWYPFDYKRSVVFEIVYLHQIVTVFVEIFVNLNGAAMAGGLLAYLGAECDVLVDLLRNLNRSATNGVHLDSERLTICIKYHKKIVEYSSRAEVYFSKYLLMQFTASGVSTALIMTGLSLNQGNINADFSFLTVLQLGVWADLYIYCWYGNEVTEKILRTAYSYFMLLNQLSSDE